MTSNQTSDQQTPMSEAQLTAIRARHERTPGSSLAETQRDISQAFFDRASLLAEVERLRAREAPMPNKTLAEIQARVTGDDDPTLYWNGMSGALEQAEADRATLLAEVERQRADCAGCEHVTQAEQESREAAQQIAGDALLKLNECKCQVDDLLADVERLKARDEQMREIVAAVAEADNSDNSVCYQLCRVRFIWHAEPADYEAEMIHDAPCVVEQARALLAALASETADDDASQTAE